MKLKMLVALCCLNAGMVSLAQRSPALATPPPTPQADSPAQLDNVTQPYPLPPSPAAPLSDSRDDINSPAVNVIQGSPRPAPAAVTANATGAAESGTANRSVTAPAQPASPPIGRNATVDQLTTAALPGSNATAAEAPVLAVDNEQPTPPPSLNQTFITPPVISTANQSTSPAPVTTAPAAGLPVVVDGQSTTAPPAPVAALPAAVLAPGASTALAPAPSPVPAVPGSCQRVIMPFPPKEGDFTDTLNATVAVSPRRPSADVPVGAWIPGRATFYGADARLDASRVACGEPSGQFGFLEQGSCGYTNSDKSLIFPREVYAAAADANTDYAGSCGRCYQIRCRTGTPENNGRPLQLSDLPFNRGVYLVKDNYGRDWPGNFTKQPDISWTQCWNENDVITIKVSDSCPCKYAIKETGETRTQNWCCGGHNHFDISFWAFERLAHPSYGVMKIEYRPVDCESNQPVKSIPGYVSQTIFDDTFQAGWGTNPYDAKDYQLTAAGQGVSGSAAICGTLSQSGAFSFTCRECSRSGYQPFGKALVLQFDIRSTTTSEDPFASSTPPGQLPPLKLFMMNDEQTTYCGAEVVLSADTGYARKLAEGGWFRVSIPLSAWKCNQGSVGSLANVDRVDFQNVEERDANICLDNIALA